MKSRLAVICSKNPTNILLETVTKLKEYYPEFDIVIIDSNSQDTHIYDSLPSDCMVELCKNNNYELGAWVYAFNKYNTYDVYMFIQDSLIPKTRIPNFDSVTYENGTVYTFHYNATVGGGGYYDNLKNVYRNTHLDYIAEMEEDTPILASAHNSFILDKEHVPILLKLEEPYIEKKLIKSKIDSWLTERTVGIVSDKYNLKRINIWDFFKKVNGNRM